MPFLRQQKRGGRGEEPITALTGSWPGVAALKGKPGRREEKNASQAKQPCRERRLPEPEGKETTGQASCRSTCQEVAPARLALHPHELSGTVQGTPTGGRACPGLAQLVSSPPKPERAGFSAQPMLRSSRRAGKESSTRGRGKAAKPREEGAPHGPSRPDPTRSPLGPEMPASPPRGQAKRSARAQGRPARRAPAPRRPYLGRRLLQLLPAEPTGRRGGAAGGGGCVEAPQLPRGAAGGGGGGGGEGRASRTRSCGQHLERARGCSSAGGALLEMSPSPLPPRSASREKSGFRTGAAHPGLCLLWPCECGCWEGWWCNACGDARGLEMPFKG